MITADLENLYLMIEILKNDGANDIAEEINAAIEGASTGTELFGMAAVAIKKVSHSNVPDTTKARAKKLRNEIGKLLDMELDD